MNEFYHKFYSQYLQRDFEMLVFGITGNPVIIFPQAGGRYYDMKDFGVVEGLREKLETGKIKIYCPDTIDYESWYNYDIEPSQRIKRHLQYQLTILRDVIDFAKYELDASTVGLAGFEFGAYHSTNIMFRYPDIISSLYCLGGTYDIKKHIMGYYDDNCYYNNPIDYFPGLIDEWHLTLLRKRDLRICVGSNDKNFDENIYLSDLLGRKQIKHQFEMCHGIGYDFEYYKSKLCSYF